MSETTMYIDPAEAREARTEFNNRIKPKYRKNHEPVCARCGRYSPWGEGMEIHHKVALIDGGTSDESNLIVMCGPCHYEYHMDDRSIDEFIKSPPGSLLTFLFSKDKEMAKWAIDNWDFCKKYLYESTFLRHAMKEASRCNNRKRA